MLNALLADPVLTGLFELIERLGPVGIPLALSAVAVAIGIPERAFVLIRSDGVSEDAVSAAVACAKEHDRAALREHAEMLSDAFRTGALVLIDAEPDDKLHREEATSLWLEGHSATLNRRLGLLQLISAIAPLLGLLGTVIGMVVAFKAIAEQNGPVVPALLADGLWQAMLTTISGLTVALPAIVARWFFAAVAAARVARLAGALSRLSLAMEAFVQAGNVEEIPPPVKGRAA